MPSVKEEPFQGFAHCTSPRCEGHNQQEVGGIRTETSFSFVENGGDLPGIERSHVYLRFASEEDRPCPHCGRIRDLSEQHRKQYAPASGHDPNGLLQIGRFDPVKQVQVRQAPLADPEREALEAQNVALLERLKALEDRNAEQDAAAA